MKNSIWVNPNLKSCMGTRASSDNPLNQRTWRPRSGLEILKMMKHKLFTFLALALLVSACAPTATQVATQAPVEPTATTEPTAAPSKPPALTGGTITIVLATDPASLDPQKATLGYSVTKELYSSLVAVDAQGRTVPYLATAWEVTPDGLTYTFHLRQDVKFHNGDPLTAEDVAWTFQRELDPATVAVAILASVDTVQALDDYTLQFTLKGPNFYFLDSLADDGLQGILDPNAVGQYGADYGRHPVGTGPYIFKEWVTGDHITLERNPDFTWGPSFTNGTPATIQTFMFRIIPEPATVVAGLEAGEIDYVPSGSLLTYDTNNLAASGMFDIVRRPNQGLYPYVSLNLEKAPFDDVRVRQALNYATNKRTLMNIVAPNSGAVIQNGPLSATQEGYWAGIEEMGYAYDLEKARQLMLDAGYTYNAGGMFEKDGQPLSFELILGTGYEMLVKPGEILQAQWKDFGVDVQLVQEDFGAAITEINKGHYTACLMGWSWQNSEMLSQLFLSNNIGTGNMSRLNNPEMDAILNRMTAALDLDEHLQAAQEAQKMIVEQAYVVTLFSQISADVVSKRVKNYSNDRLGGLRFWNAYLVRGY
jgi:peptide/nickel transport system substrate-binding protein